MNHVPRRGISAASPEPVFEAHEWQLLPHLTLALVVSPQSASIDVACVPFQPCFGGANGVSTGTRMALIIG